MVVTTTTPLSRRTAGGSHSNRTEMVTLAFGASEPTAGSRNGSRSEGVSSRDGPRMARPSISSGRSDETNTGHSLSKIARNASSRTYPESRERRAASRLRPTANISTSPGRRRSATSGSWMLCGTSRRLRQDATRARRRERGPRFDRPPRGPSSRRRPFVPRYPRGRLPGFWPPVD